MAKAPDPDALVPVGEQLGGLVELLELAPALVELDELEARLRDERGERAPAARVAAATARKPGESKPEPWPSTTRICWYSHGDICSSISSEVVTYRRQSTARRIRRTAAHTSPASSRTATSSISVEASFSHSSELWCTVWKSSSSRWTDSCGVFCSASSSSVRR